MISIDDLLWNGVRCTSNVRVPMRDGAELAADVFVPPGPEQPRPTVLVRTPYSRARPDHHLMALYLASHGYTVLVQDCRGRFDSDGDFRFLFATEGDDGFDTLTWIVEQPWCNGRVGTTGMSFEGANQQALALTRHPALMTQVILDAGINYYTHTMREHGAFNQGIAAPYVMWMARTSKEARADPAIAQAQQTAMDDSLAWLTKLPWQPGHSPVRNVPIYEDWYFRLVEGAYCDYWNDTMPIAEPHLSSSYPDIPVLYATGWYGHHLWASFRRMELLAHHNTPKVLLVGTWMHTSEFSQAREAGDVDFGNTVLANLNDYRLRWFDAYLKGTDLPAFTGSAIQYVRMGGGPGGLTPTGKLEHGSTWQGSDVWPPAGAIDTVLTVDLAQRTLVADSTPDAATLDFPSSRANPVPTIGGGHAGSGPRGGFLEGGGMDQRERRTLACCHDTLPLAARNDVVSLRTPPLESDLEVTGPVYVDLWFSSSVPAADLTVKLIDEYPASAEHPDGFALNLVDTIQRFASWTQHAPVTGVDEPTKVTVGPLHTSNLFVKGHRLRIDIAGSNYPLYDWHPESPAERITRLYSGPSHNSLVRLPIVGAG